MRTIKNISTVILLTAIVISCASKKPKTDNTRQPESRKIDANLIMSDSGYALGSEIGFSMTVSSAAADTIELMFPTACKSKFVVSRDGYPIWNSLDGVACTQKISRIKLAPGDTTAFRAVWDCKSASEKGVVLGKYEVVGVLLSSPPVETEKAAFYLVD